MSLREPKGKSASISLTRTVGKALADVLNNKPTAATTSRASGIVPPSEFGGAPTKSSSLRRLSLQPGSKTGASGNLGIGSPPTGPGASGRVSRSSSTPTLDKKLATLPEEAPKPPAPTKAKGRLSKSPKPSVLQQPSALPKYKPKVSSLVSTAPAKVPPSPVRLGTRKRRQSEDSSSATLSSGSATANDAAKDTLSPPVKPPVARPVSPLPKRATKTCLPPPPKAAPSPKASPSASSIAKENAASKKDAVDSKKDGSPLKKDGSPLKKVARHTPSLPRLSSPAVSVRPPSTNSSPAGKTPSKAPLKTPSKTPLIKKKSAADTSNQNITSPSSANDSQEVSFMLNDVVSPTQPTPVLPRLRPPLPRTPGSIGGLPGRNRLSYASPLGTRGSILSWEDMSRSFGANVDELGTFLTDVSAPFTPRDRTVSVFSDASMTGMSDAWGSPRTSGIGLTPSLSISQVMFPTPPPDAVGDASFGDITATSPIRPDDVSTQGEELDEEADAQQLFGPADPDERQAAVMLLQLQLAALEGVREERDALRAERDTLLDAKQRAGDEERARMMQEEVAQEERVARVAAEERASEEAQRVSEAQSAIREMQGRLRTEAARGAAAEWRAAVEMLRAELMRLKSEREVLDVVRDCAVVAAAASA